MHIALLDIIQLYCALFVQKVPMLNKLLLKSNYYWIMKKKNREKKTIGMITKRVPNNKTWKQIGLFFQNL